MVKPENGNFLREIEALLNGALGYPHGTLRLKELLNVHGGGEIYLPTSTDLYVEWRNRQIIVEFRGDNHKEISRKWGLKVRQVRNIIQRNRGRL